MRLLLDENLPHDLRSLIVGHEVFTVAYMKWSGVQNGELLRRAAAAAFDALLTKDSAMQSQQDPRTVPIPVIVLEAATNEIEDITPLLPALLSLLSAPLVPGFMRLRLVPP